MEQSCVTSSKVPCAYRSPALIVGHPGHELKLFGWMSANRPFVYVLTDGSGHGGISRLPKTSRLLEQVGATPAEIYGAMSDAQIYQAILEKDIQAFLSIADALTQSFVEHRIDFVVGDAAEGFNPTHDLCRQLTDAAVLAAQCCAGLSIQNYEVCLTEWERNCAESHDHECWHLSLEDQALRSKLHAAREYVELKEEVERAVALKGEEYFRVECLRRVGYPLSQLHRDSHPLYEEVGKQRVLAGKYSSAITYEAHIVPILQALQDHAMARKVA